MKGQPSSSAILFPDEATNSLDARGEERISACLAGVSAACASSVRA